MRYNTVALAATPFLLATQSLAYGNAKIKNSCGFDAYLWSCGDTAGERITIKAGDTHTEAYYSKKDNGGPSLKIAAPYMDGPRKGEAPDSIFDQPQPPITQYEYTLGKDRTPASRNWYDISNIDGYPFVIGGLNIKSSDGKQQVHCPKDVKLCKDAYNVPKDDHATGDVSWDLDLEMVLCYDAPGITIDGAFSGGNQGGNDTESEQPAPSKPKEAPKVAKADPVKVNKKVAVDPPKTTPKPTPTEEEDVVVFVTEYHTEVVTEVSQQKVKRDDAGHIHQHVHNKIHKKRHQFAA